MKKINADMSISEILDLDEDIHQVFLRNGLNCVGCPGAVSESLKEAAKGHRVDLDRLLSDLNEYIKIK